MMHTRYRPGKGGVAALVTLVCAGSSAPALSAGAAASSAAPAVAAAPGVSAGIKGFDAASRRSDGAWVIKGKLAGNGVIGLPGTRVITGKVAPGNSPGCVTDQGNVIFDSGASLEIEIGGTTPCTQFDQYAVALTLTLNGPTLNVLLVNGFVPAAGQRFRVLSWGTLVGTFGQANLPALPAGLAWDTTALYTTGELVVNGPVVPPTDGDVPLPPWALATLGAGLVVMLARRQRR